MPPFLCYFCKPKIEEGTMPPPPPLSFLELVNTMIKQQGNNAHCPRVLLPGCNKKHKNKKKKKVAHTNNRSNNKTKEKT
jgi:hypothetical protein